VEQELAIDLPAEPAPEIGPVLVELELDQVAGEPERDLVVAVPELAQEVVVPARGPLRAQLAVALITRSVIARRHPDLVPLLAAGDLAAAVAVTTRERAATEGVTAWEAADTVAVEAAALTEAVAAAVVVVVAADVAVAEDGDNIR
jgi:hypothetical protein